MSRLRSIICPILFGVLMLSGVIAPAGATSSRILALGGDGDYFEDETNVMRWYGSLVGYPDLAILELGDILESGDSPAHAHRLPAHGGGFHFGLGGPRPRSVFAAYFEDDLPGDQPGGAFSAVWARRFGAVQAGFFGRFTTFGERIVDSSRSDSGATQYFHHFGLGLRFDLNPRAYVDVAVEIINSQAESLDAVHHLPPTDDWQSFGLRLRGFRQLSETVVLVPLLDHYHDIRATYSPILSGPADLDRRCTRLGVGINILSDADNLVVVSGEYRYGREDLRLRDAETLESQWDTSERSFFQLRGRVGAESRVLPWLSLRGAVQYVRLDDESGQATLGDAAALRDVHIERVITPVSVGFGLYLGPVTADFIYNDAAPVNPGFLGEGLLLDQRDGFSSLSVRLGF